MVALATSSYGVLGIEYVPGRSRTGRGVESFSARPDRLRIRLSADEARNVRYVFCDWSSEAGFGSSSSAAQLERLAASPHLLGPRTLGDRAGAKRIERAIEAEVEQAWRRAWLADRATSQHITVRGGVGSHYRNGTLTPIERWCDRALEPVGARVRRSEFGDRIHHCWRALRDLADDKAESLRVLYALYGDTPPGLLSIDVWDDVVNREYVRVIRFVPEAGSSTAELEGRLRIDRHRRKTEGDEAYKTRLAAATAERGALVHRLGAACEDLIERATVDYRDAWRLTS